MTEAMGGSGVGAVELSCAMAGQESRQEIRRL
jgi:hypothetical protein